MREPNIRKEPVCMYGLAVYFLAILCMVWLCLYVLCMKTSFGLVCFYMLMQKDVDRGWTLCGERWDYQEVKNVFDGLGCRTLII